MVKYRSSYEQEKIIEKFYKKVCTRKIFALSLHSQSGKRLHFRSGIYNAEIAQLVEHNLAKVGVASSSLVFRSKSQKRSRCFLDLFLFCLLGYVTYPPNPLSVKGAYGAESVVCTSDPKLPPVRGLGGVKIVREKCPRMRARGSFSAPSPKVLRTKSSKTL